MDCMRSFSFLSSANENAVGAEIKTWGLAPQNYWLYQSQSQLSTFNIQGFKNVNVHSVEAQGVVSTLITGTEGIIVNDWDFSITVNGQNPLINGNITAAPNNFSIQTQGLNPTFVIGKYSPKFTFADPIQSASSIQITQLRASGIGAQNLANINIAWAINFIVYYTYEGE